MFSDEALGRRLDIPVEPQRGRKKENEGRRAESLYRDTQARGGRCPERTHSGKGCSLFSDEALGRRLDMTVGPQRWRQKKKGPEARKGFTVTLRRRVLAVPAGYTQAKGARCPATTHSGEGCSLSSDEALGRRLDLTVGPQRGRTQKGKGPTGSELLR